MIILKPYERAMAAAGRCREIQEQLHSLDVKNNAMEVDGLVKEFEWTVRKIISICNEVLDQEPTGDDIVERVKIEKLLEQYKAVWDEMLTAERDWTTS